MQKRVKLNNCTMYQPLRGWNPVLGLATYSNDSDSQTFSEHVICVANSPERISSFPDEFLLKNDPENMKNSPEMAPKKT